MQEDASHNLESTAVLSGVAFRTDNAALARINKAL